MIPRLEFMQQGFYVYFKISEPSPLKRYNFIQHGSYGWVFRRNGLKSGGDWLNWRNGIYGRVYI